MLGRNLVSSHEIAELVQRIADEFKPVRIILFGSYAYGRPGRNSDVDLLVLTPYRGHAAQVAGRILLHADPTFAVDVLVRSPAEVRQAYRRRDGFIREIIDLGKVVYDARDGRLGR